MKNTKTLILLSSILLLSVVSCKFYTPSSTGKESTPSVEQENSLNSENESPSVNISSNPDSSSINESSPKDESTTPIIPSGDYNEPQDSLDGVDASDLSALKNVFDNLPSNYTKHTKTYFNQDAIDIVNEIYKINYIQEKTTLHIAGGHYEYDKSLSYSKAFFGKNSKTYLASLIGNTLSDVIETTINDKDVQVLDEIKDYESYFFNFNDLNSNYVSTYGPTTKDGFEYLGWTRISANKYQCDRLEVLQDFLSFLTPGLPNDGDYMTYSHVTVEINDDNSLRFRLYASTTQSGKMIDTHKEKEDKPNWYMLFAEATFEKFDKTSMPAIENYLSK